jgi:hypothetical protein
MLARSCLAERRATVAPTAFDGVTTQRPASGCHRSGTQSGASFARNLLPLASDKFSNAAQGLGSSEGCLISRFRPGEPRSLAIAACGAGDVRGEWCDARGVRGAESCSARLAALAPTDHLPRQICQLRQPMSASVQLPQATALPAARQNESLIFLHGWVCGAIRTPPRHEPHIARYPFDARQSVVRWAALA